MSFSKAFSSILLTLALITGYAQAVEIEVINPSFEDYLLVGGYYTSSGEGLIGYGWEVEEGIQVGVYRPSVSVFPSIPDSLNTAYSHGPVISQVLSAVLEEGVDYTLTVEVGNPAGLEGFPGYRIQLWAGDSLLAEDDNTLTPAEGEFMTSTVEYSSPLGDLNAGQPLEIRLVSLGAEVNFDLIQLHDNLDVAIQSKTWGQIKRLYSP